MPQPPAIPQQSVSTLAQLALHHARADGYALYILNTETGALTRQFSAGALLPQPADVPVSRSLTRSHDVQVISYPLRVERSVIGLLAFAFKSDSIPGESVMILDRLAAAIERVYCLPHFAASLFAKVSDREMELAASKISDRTQGILGNASSPDPLGEIALVERHVESVLRSLRLGSVLENLLEEVEAKISERSLTSQAKALLQQTRGMSEEQAWNHLRLTSRRTRRRVTDIAKEVIASAARAA